MIDAGELRAQARTNLGKLGDRIPALDGLRALAILLVMFYHFGTSLDRGSLPQHIARAGDAGAERMQLYARRAPISGAQALL
jgi:uncharacterized membrane protein